RGHLEFRRQGVIHVAGEHLRRLPLREPIPVTSVLPLRRPAGVNGDEVGGGLDELALDPRAEQRGLGAGAGRRGVPRGLGELPAGALVQVPLDLDAAPLLLGQVHGPP
ncbi:unnamed protein product, partial [Ectocarpus fasciculatus]